MGEGNGDRKKETKEIMNEHFLSLTKTINTEIQETQQTPNTTNMKKTTGRYIIIMQNYAKIMQNQ